MLLFGPNARRESFFYDEDALKYVATSVATAAERREIEECNARHERVRVKEKKERMEAEQNLKKNKRTNWSGKI